MNDTPQGDGNKKNDKINKYLFKKIRMNDTPQGDGNLAFQLHYFFDTLK